MAEKSQQDPLARYRSKRNFALTSEPRGGGEASGAELAFVVQKHHAGRLHYDFRLELDGVMLSWAVPKGPSFDPKDMRMAIRVEDHPISYNSFEGTIPRGQYGAGMVIVWDNGRWEPAVDPHQGLKDGKLVFTLHGHKLLGLWELVRIAKPGDKQEPWLLFKKRDKHAQPRAAYDVVSALPDSVIAKPLKAPPAGAAGPTGAVKAPMPATLAPQLASLASAAPTSDAWSWEIKFDGYRLMARIEDGKVRLITRGGHDWSSKMPALVKALQSLRLESAWLDGEIVAMGSNGAPDFHALQNAFDRSRTETIDYFLFDLPYLEGHDLRATPLLQRRQLLKQLIDEHPHEHLRFSADFDADATSILESARRLGLEGVIAKRKDAPYESRRTETWLKLKNKLRQEFVVVGYSDRSSGEAEIGSLLLGVYDNAGGQLVYVGNVGTGWNAATAAKLKTQLKKIEVGASPFGAKPLRQHRWAVRDPAAQHFVKPKLVAEVEFSDWTPDSQVRHARFVGLRPDKKAKTVKRESAVTPQGPALVTAGSSIVAGVKVSHPERIIDASTGVTKLELVRYYESVADWMLPHLIGRPCSLVRGPTGVGGELFFQRHVESLQVTGVKELDTALWPGHAPLLEVVTKEALITAAQLNVIEFHTWNALVRKMDQPDRVIFDLDPGEGERWERVQEAATLVRGLLQELGLQSWLKTSGGKGLHVVVPIAPVAPRDDWDTVKGFAQAVVQHLAQVIPQRFTARMGAANRVGKLYVDYLRNNHGATTAAAFSARSRPGLGVSIPLAWDDLSALKRSDQWTVRTTREHLSFQPADPWQSYWTCKQTLAAALKTLGLTAPVRAAGRKDRRNHS